MISSRLRSVAWFLRRPTLYPQLAYLIWDRLVRAPEADTSAEAEKWCQKRAVTGDEALNLLTGIVPEPRVEDLHAAEFEEAVRIEKNCPVSMGGPGDLNLLYHLVKRTQAARVIETGVAYGWSSLAILLALEKNPDALLISSDMPYVQDKNDAYVGCVVYKGEWRRKWDLVRKSDRQAIPYAIKKLGTIDLCHYDSDKSYRGRAWAYPKLWAALRPGGLFISDDVGDNLGFRDFSAQVGIEPIVVLVKNERYAKFVGIIRKP